MSNHVYEVTFQYPETDNVVSIKIIHPEKVHLVDVPDILIEKNMVDEKTIEYITDVKYLGEIDNDDELSGTLIAFEQALLTPTKSKSTVKQFNELCEWHKLNDNEYSFFYDNGNITKGEITLVIIPICLDDLDDYGAAFLNGHGLGDMKQYRKDYLKTLIGKYPNKCISVNFIKTDDPAISKIQSLKNASQNTDDYIYPIDEYTKPLKQEVDGYSMHKYMNELPEFKYKKYKDISKKFCSNFEKPCSDISNNNNGIENKLIPIIDHLSGLADKTGASVHMNIDITKCKLTGKRDVLVSLNMKDY